MTDFDIIGSNLYGGQGAAPASGFDIVAPNAGGRPMPGQGQPGAAQGQGQPVQPQGAPVSGLLAGLLGLPTYGGAVPGAAYLTPGQPQQSGGQAMQPQQAQQLLQLLQSGGVPGGGSQPQNGAGLFGALGSGSRSLLDGIAGLGN